MGRESDVLNKNYPAILKGLKVDPKAVVAQLKPSGILADSVLDYVQNDNHGAGDKAGKILDAVILQVQINSQVIHVFIKALRDTENPGIQACADLLKRELSQAGE